MSRIFNGSKAAYQVLETIKPNIFKAKVLASGSETSYGIGHNKRFVLIKDLTFERELKAQRVPQVLSCPFIRQLEDVIDNFAEHNSPNDGRRHGSIVKKGLVFEWMDSDLWHLRPFGASFKNPRLPKIVAKSVLEALKVFHELRSVHSDISPNNVFVTGSDSTAPLVKLGDLDNAFSEGVAKGNPRAQTEETRAPEVWKGQGVWHQSDTWSLGVTMAHWLTSRTISGTADKIIKDHSTAWSLAKIRRLIGPVESPKDLDDEEEFELARALELGQYRDAKTGIMTPYITIQSLQEELGALPKSICSSECIDFIQHLLIIDADRRPTAEEALRHPFIL